MRARVLSLLMVVAWSVARSSLAADPSTLPSESSQPPPWLEITTTTPANDVKSRYKASLRLSDKKLAGSFGSRPVQVLAPEPDAALAQTTFSQEMGPLAGGSTFFWRTGDRWPVAMLHWRFPDPHRYLVHADVRCREPGTECDAASARARALAMRSPMPVGTEDKTVFAAWRDLVVGEACRPGVARMPVPLYPKAEVRRGIGGKVTLQILTNRCGEIRSLQVFASSGNRVLDLQAMETVRHWRLPVDEIGPGGYVRVPVTFHPP